MRSPALLLLLFAFVSLATQVGKMKQNGRPDESKTPTIGQGPWNFPPRSGQPSPGSPDADGEDQVSRRLGQKTFLKVPKGDSHEPQDGINGGQGDQRTDGEHQRQGGATQAETGGKHDPRQNEGGQGGQGGTDPNGPSGQPAQGQNGGRQGKSGQGRADPNGAGGQPSQGSNGGGGKPPETGRSSNGTIHIVTNTVPPATPVAITAPTSELTTWKNTSPSSKKMSIILTSSPSTSTTTATTSTNTTTTEEPITEEPTTTTTTTTTTPSTTTTPTTTVTEEATTVVSSTIVSLQPAKSSTANGTTHVIPPFVPTIGTTTALPTTDRPEIVRTVETTDKSAVPKETTAMAPNESTVGSGNGSSGASVAHEKPEKKRVHWAMIVVPAVVLLVLIVIVVVIVVVIRHKQAKRLKSKEKTSKRSSLEKKKPKSDVKAGSKTGKVTKGSKMQMYPPLIKKKRPPQPKQVQAGKLDREHYKFVGPLRMDAALKGPVRHGTEQAPRSSSLKDIIFDDKDNKVYEIGSDVEVLEKQTSHSVVVDDDNALIVGSVNQKTPH